MTRTAWRFFVWLGLSVFFAPTFLPAAESAKSADDSETVMLPQMVVVESKFDANPWLYAQAPGFEILSKLSEGATREYVAGFIRSEQMLAAMVPDALWGRSRQPMVLVIVPGSATTANADLMRKMDIERMRTQDENRDPADAFASARAQLRRMYKSNAAQQLVSYYDAETTVFFNRRVDPRQSTVNFAAGNQGADVLHGRSLYRYLAERRAPPMPPWLAEGLVTVLAQGHLYVNSLTWTIDPLFPWPDQNGVYGIPTNIPDRFSGMTNLPALLRLKRIVEEPPPPHDAKEFRLWSHHCALFVRWGFGKAAFWNFVAGVEREGASEELFERCFGFGYNHVDVMLAEEFFELTKRLVVKVKSMPPKLRLKFRVASDLEIRRLVAELVRLQSEYLRPHYPDLAAEYLESALQTLGKNKGGAEKDPEFMAVWGLSALAAGDTAKARACLEVAAAGEGVERPQVHLALARLRYEEALKNLPAENAPLAAAELDAVLAPLLRALALPPPSREAFQLLLDVCERGTVAFDADSRRALQAATKLFPADRELAERIERLLRAESPVTESAAAPKGGS